MIREEQPQIGIMLANDFPEDITEGLKAPGLELEIRRFPFGGPYASLQWAIPTMIGVYILKPYFDSYLKELGKEHYEILKRMAGKYIAFADMYDCPLNANFLSQASGLKLLCINSTGFDRVDLNTASKIYW